MGDPSSLSEILWSTDPTTRRALWMVLGLALVATATIFLPLVVRLVRLGLLERKLREVVGGREGRDGATDPALRQELREAFVESPLRETWQEFERRWTTAQITEGFGRAPIRLIDCFDERPLLPFGPRRALLPVLPGLFLAVGLFGALTGLIPGLTAPSGELGAGSPDWVAQQLGLALRAAAWGFLFAIAASLGGRLIDGLFEARSRSLDRLVESAFGSVSPGELAELTRQTQQASLETLGRELTQFADELNERLERGLQRIEQSTARSANLVSQEQRGALHTVVQELSLSVRQGVEHHLSELRAALQRAVDHQASVTGGLAETFERMVENAATQDRVARTLADSASAVEEAARTMRSSTTEMQPVLEHLGTTSRALADTADRIGETQSVVARTAEGVRTSLEHAATGVSDQREFIELSLTEIRRALAGLGDGLGDSLQRALREVDGVLGTTVGQLRDTLAESNETIDRLSIPIRATEGSTREIHLALDRVRSEVEALGQWLNQAARPVRAGIVDVEGRVEDIARAISEFTNHTRHLDKTMETLREEIREESRRLQSTGSELGRRLVLASETAGLIESAEPGRRGRGNGTIASRERSWSAAPSARPAWPGGDPAQPPTRSERPADDEPPAYDERSEGSVGWARDERSGGREARVDEGASREVALPSYRMGTPRAQGPDPYERFESGPDSPSNVRHFPTPDRELGDDLKLSGLLGPSRSTGRGREVEGGEPDPDAATRPGLHDAKEDG
ncbi:MAG: hypothetical protein KC616_24185 [Myxococcales bacterium]|nr:hypothetical protein [Myxococcales bacterium]